MTSFIIGPFSVGNFTFTRIEAHQMPPPPLIAVEGRYVNVLLDGRHVLRRIDGSAGPRDFHAEPGGYERRASSWHRFNEAQRRTAPDSQRIAAPRLDSMEGLS